MFPLLQQQPVKQSFCRSLRRDTHWKCLILTLLILGCLTAIAWCRLTVVTRFITNYYDMPVTRTSRASPCEDGYVYIPVAFTVMLYLVYLVECWHCHTRIELQYKVDVNTVYERVQAKREALPIVWWKAICYHYVRRTRQVTRYRNGDAFTTTQVYYERINSHTASSAFNFSSCGLKDVSRKLVNLERYPATKIRFSKGFSFATIEAEHEFEDQRAQFFQDHERRDDYMETREGLDLLNVNFKEYMIAFADPDNLPWYVSHVVFWLASMALMSWPLRVLIEFKTAYVHYHVHKLFGTNYVDAPCYTGQMTRVSTMGSSELEMTIRNNYNMVPSYSEALLMDGRLPTSQDSNANLTSSASFYIPRPGANSLSSQQATLLGSMPNGRANYGTHVLQNGVRVNRSVPNISGVLAVIRRSWSGDTADVLITSQQQRRLQRRKRKRRRHSYTEATHPESTENVPQIPSRTQTPITPSTPESPSEVTSTSTRSMESVAEHVSGSSTESTVVEMEMELPVRPRHTCTPSSNRSPHRSPHRLAGVNPGDRTEPHDGASNSSAHGIRAVGSLSSIEAPPSYEEALSMRVASNTSSPRHRASFDSQGTELPERLSHLERRTSSTPLLRLMETSL